MTQWIRRILLLVVILPLFAWADAQQHGLSQKGKQDVLVEESANDKGPHVDERRRFYDSGELRLYQRKNAQGEVTEEKEYEKNGDLISQMFVEETDYGPTRVNKTWKDKRLVRLERFSMDRRWSLVEEYDASGDLKNRRERLDGEWLGLRVSTTDYLDTKSIEYQQYGSPGEPHGEKRIVDESGETILLETYLDGELHGPYLLRTDGRITAKGEYHRGKRVGSWQGYSLEDKATWSGTYVDGKRDGYWLARFDEGYDHFRGRFDKGVPVGTHLLFSLDGSLKETRPYVDGLLHGEYTFYNEGAVSFTRKYENGRRVTE